MDKKNLKMLGLLNRNSRVSLGELSKEILSSKQATYQRMKRLEKENILGYEVVVDSFRLDFENLYLYLKISGLDDEEFIKRMGSIKKLNHITWIARLFGDFDVVVSFRYRNRSELFKSLDMIYKEFGKSIKKKQYFFSRKFIIPCLTFDQSEVRSLFVVGEDNKSKYILSKVQEKILGEININTRKSYSEISKKLKMSPKTVKKCLNELEKEKIILGYTAIMDYSSLGFLWNSCILNITPGSDISKLINSLKNNYRVSWIAISIENSILFDFLSKDFYSLRNFVNQLKVRYNDEIFDYQTMNISDIIKFK